MNNKQKNNMLNEIMEKLEENGFAIHYGSGNRTFFSILISILPIIKKWWDKI